MNTKNKFKHMRSKIAYTILVALLLCIVFFAMTNYIYHNAEGEAFEDLHVQTKEIKEDITLQMISDSENLTTMASFASKLYSDGESFDLMFNSFKSIGLIENIGILTPDNTFLTKVGTINTDGILSFSAEAKKGKYISRRVPDITNPKREVIRSSVPIISNGETVGILYGVIELKRMEERYKPMADLQNAQLYVVERGNGNFIIDTMRSKLGNIASLDNTETKNGYSYKQMSVDMKAGNSGYSALMSQTTGEYLYIHYAPLEIGDWQIMLLKPESIVFAKAKHTRHILFIVCLIVVLIMGVYFLLIFTSEKKHSKMNLCASKIRKLLLEINQNYESIYTALEIVTSYAKSRSAFFVDTDGEDFNYILPYLENKLLCKDDRLHFIDTLMSYAVQHHNSRSVMPVKFTANSHLKKIAPEFYSFMVKHDISRVTFAVISNNTTTSILGVINPQKSAKVGELLCDIAVCFSMAIYNKKYLNKTEFIAVTDSLTGLSNRTAYKRDVSRFDKIMPENFACIYIDVNELHIINNTYGHSVGDAMLLTIADNLKETFRGHYIYRMGGDEFLVFIENLSKNEISDLIDELSRKTARSNYNISIGMDYRKKNVDTESLVKEAEKRMYEAKAEYYQKKERKNTSALYNKRVQHITTGIREIDAILSVMSMRYLGIYCVSFKTDTSRSILVPDYFKDLSDSEKLFSKSFSRYIHELVSPDYHRALLNFLNYDVLKKQLSEEYIPSITYKKIDGEKVALNVYALPDHDKYSTECIWIFERAN